MPTMDQQPSQVPNTPIMPPVNRSHKVLYAIAIIIAVGVIAALAFWAAGKNLFRGSSSKQVTTNQNGGPNLTPPPTTTPSSSWKTNVANQFQGLTDWTQTSETDWSLVEMNPSKLKPYEKGNLNVLSKTFNGKNDPEDFVQAKTSEDALVTSVNTALSKNGWKLVAQPTEGGFYHDYLYVKDNHPLVVEVGTRDAVIGGMYVSIQYEY